MTQVETAATPKAMHRAIMDQMAHDQMKELVQQALKEAYEPKPKKGADTAAPTEPSYDERCRIVDKGMTNDRVTFEQKGKTFTQGYAIKNGSAGLLGTRQPVMITYAAIPGAGAVQDSGAQDAGVVDEGAQDVAPDVQPVQPATSKKGKVPAGLAAYLANKKAAKG